MKNIFLIFTALSILAFSFSACEKTTTPTYGELNVQFDFVFGAAELPFALNQQFVHPMTADTLTFTKMQFYVSNVRLKKSDGTWWEEADSYHLVCHNCSGYDVDFHIHDVPTGTYTMMEYTLGVDSLHNVSGAQSGALSPTNDMFWDWNSGYIMMKAEGTSPQSNNGGFEFHFGGFSGANNIVTPKSTNFNGSTLTIAETTTPKVKFKANPARLWHTSSSVFIVSMAHMPSAITKTMATDFYSNISYSGME